MVFKWANDNLIAESWFREKACRITIDTGACDHRPERHHRTTARKESETPLRSANGVWEHDPLLAGGARGKSGTECLVDLSVRGRDHARVLSGAGYPVRLRGVGRHAAP